MITSKVVCTFEMKILIILFCISLSLHYLCTDFLRYKRIMAENSIDTINSIGTGRDIVSELSNLDFSKIAWGDVVGYVVQFGKNVLIAIIVFIVGRFIIKYTIKALRTVTQKRNVEASLTSFLNSFCSTMESLYLPPSFTISARQSHTISLICSMHSCKQRLSAVPQDMQ